MPRALLATTILYHARIVTASPSLLNLSCTTTILLIILDSALILINTIFELSADLLDDALDINFGEFHARRGGRIPKFLWRVCLAFLAFPDEFKHVLTVLLRVPHLLADYAEADMQFCPKLI